LPALKLWPVGTVIAAVLAEIRRDDTAADGAEYATLADPPLTAVEATFGCAVYVNVEFATLAMVFAPSSNGIPMFNVAVLVASK
jgi:hypothetical protein